MTTDEIKQQYSMRDVLTMYGIGINRSGFCSCPFHGADKHPSMKIYAKDFHCFTCNANGDIFTFVQKMEGCSFKDAFLKLGGNYEKKSPWQQKRFEYELQQKKKKAEAEKQKRLEEIDCLYADIKMQELFKKTFPVFSDEWCEAVNKIERNFARLEELQKGG